MRILSRRQIETAVDLSLSGLARTTATSNRYVRETRSAQLDETFRLARYSAGTPIGVALALILFFWNTTGRPFVIALSVAIAVMAVLAVVAVRLFSSRVRSERAVTLGHRIAAAFAFLLGSIWGFVPIALIPAADADHRMVLVATATGVIADVYLMGPILSVCLLFLIPMLIGSFIGVAMIGDFVGAMMALLLSIYALFLGFTIKDLTGLSTQRIRDRARVAEQSETIALLLREFEENTSDWLWEIDAQGRLLQVSDRAAQAAGCSADALLGAPFEALFLGQGHGSTIEDAGALRDFIALRTQFHDHVVEVRGPSRSFWWKLSGKPLYGKDDRFKGFRGVVSDVTAVKATDARIAFMASHDALTGLGNRNRFQFLATQACRAAAMKGTPFGLLYLDLDGFKSVNDTFGHETGDRLLREVAARLLARLPAGASAARLGGDEFAILHSGPDAADAAALAKSLVESLGAPYYFDGHFIEISVSIGIASAPKDAADPKALLAKADLALYRAKANGKDRYDVFDVAIEHAIMARRELETDLKLALARGEFELHYQPLVCLADGRIVAFEALLRWQHEIRGIVAPTIFIPVAEAIGLISPIGTWALTQACMEAARWQSKARVAVNISPVHFRRADFVQTVLIALERSTLAAGRLEIEITEGVFLENSAAAIANLNQLRKIGVRIAIDDFGTGFSSLNYLIRFPVDKIKIDQSFVRDVISRPACLAVIDAILTLAQKLSISVTAEGVETIEQAALLKQHGCHDIQGFLLSPARPKEDIDFMLRTIPRRLNHYMRGAVGSRPARGAQSHLRKVPNAV
ncbi:bifunctional diguanylate cyclase/phosphodiesterase [Beijerinckia sp. L45]|uniref:putative bifunctional diguanylate cyclase/phosphodiesterase n=1 Tax=Beijerinckia sp. L45 TaxID=1641855 RepID=UPI00131A8F3B|nr:EAL domain-containing protein [Beijerinckia sp. L45]